jgi:predicted RNase H-like HicB family nuclease
MKRIHVGSRVRIVDGTVLNAAPMATYLALMRKEPHGDFEASFPDLPPCRAAGSTLDEAEKLAAEALALSLRAVLNAGERLPAPSSLDQIRGDPRTREAMVFPVRVADPVLGP